MKFFTAIPLLLLLPAAATAGSYQPQNSFSIPVSTVAGLDTDAVGNLYVLGLANGTTTFGVSGFRTPNLEPQFTFDTGLSTPVAFAVEPSGIVDVLNGDGGMFTLRRFQNPGGFIGGASYTIGTGMNMISTAIDRANARVYIAYQYTYHPIYLQCLGCGGPSSITRATINQYDLQGNLLKSTSMPGSDATPGSCYTPTKLAADPQGNLFVADQWCGKLLKFSADQTLAATYTASSWNFNFIPRAMWTDSGSSLYISQPVCGPSGCPQGIVKLSGDGALQASFIADSPVGCAWDQRILYLSPAATSPLQRFIFASPLSVPAETGPIGTVVQHSSAGSFGWQASSSADGDPVTYSVYLATKATGLQQIGSASQASFISSPLVFGTTYFWQVIAQASYLGLPLQAVQAPVVSFNQNLINRPPGAFSATGGTGSILTRATSATLAWQAPVDPDNDPLVYDVFWRPAAQSSATLVGTTSVPSWTMSGLSFGATYYWSVRAHDVYGAASWLANGAEQPYFSVFANSAPSAPAIIAGNGTSAQHTWSPQASLSWASVNDPEGDSVAYRLLVGTAPAALALVQDGTQTGYNLSGLVQNGTYYWQVAAYDSYGAASTTTLQSLRTVIQNQPPAPFAVVSGAGTLATRDTAQLLAWSNATDPDGDTVTYDLSLGTSPLTMTLVQSAGPTSYTANVQLGTTYYWQATARDGFGGAQNSALQTFFPVFKNTAPSLPAVVLGTGTLVAHALVPQALIDWSGSNDPDGDPVAYRVYFGTTAATLSLLQDGDATSAVIGGLQFETTYFWRVSAYDPYGGASTTTTQSLLVRLANQAPLPFAITAGAGVIATRGTSQVLSWANAVDPDGDPLTYDLACSTNPSSLVLVQTSTATTFALGTQFGTTYYWQVTARDGFGGAQRSTVQTLLTTFQNSPPATPGILSGTGTIGEHTRSPQSTLSWSSSFDPDGDSVSYRLYVGTAASALALAQDGPSTAYGLPAPQFGTTYYWQAVAYDPYGGTGATTVQSLVLTLANQAPAPFAILTGTGTVATRASTQVLSWASAFDPDGDTVSYDLSLATTPVALALVQSSTATSYALTFQLGTTYYWQVTARDGFGGAQTSALQLFQPTFRNSPPPEPVNLSKTGTIPFHGLAPSQSFFWQQSIDPDGDAVSYQVYLGTDPAALALIPSAPLGFTLTNLAVNTAYYYKIVAIDAFGAASNSSVNWVYYQFVNGAPSAFDVAAGSGTVPTRTSDDLLAWTAATDPDGDPVSYRVYFGTQSAALPLLADSKQTSAAVGPLASGTTYYWRVDAYDTLAATTPMRGGVQSLLHLFKNSPPSPISYLNAATTLSLHTSSPTATLTWAASADPDGDPVAYELDLNSGAGTSAVSVGTSTVLTIPLSFDTPYQWRVIAADPFGGVSTGAWLPLISHLANLPPNPVQYLAPATLKTRATSYMLAWTDSGDPDGDAVLYRFELGSSSAALSAVQFSSATAFPLPLQFGTTVYYRVTALDPFGAMAAGGVQALLPVFLNDPPQSPNVMGSFRSSPVIKTMKNTVTVTWEQVTDPQNDPITYTVYFGNSAQGMAPLATIAPSAQGVAALTLRPTQFAPQAQVATDGTTVVLNLTSLDYYRNYYIQVVASNPYGAQSFAPVQTFSLASGDGFPKAYNYPNPFSPSQGGTNLVFNAPPSGYAKATVEVYSEWQDLLFKKDYFNIPPGISQVRLEGRDRYGRPFFNGSYICRVRFSGPDDKTTFYLLVVK